MSGSPPGEASPGAAAPRYNEIYEKLVDSEGEDLPGLIAYSLYKQSKREWLIDHEKQHDRRPDQAEEAIFVSAFTANELRRLRDDATNMLAAYAAHVIEQEKPELIEQGRQDHLIGLVDGRLEEMRSQGRWWRQVVAGALGAFGYSILLLLLLLIIRWVGIDLIDLVQPITTS